MIDKINSQKYYEYTRAKQPSRGPVDSSEFNQNLEREGVIYEQSKKKKTTKTKETSELSGENSDRKAKANADRGVKLDISDKGYERAEKEKQRKSVVEQIRKYAAIAVDFLKSVWDKVWNEPEKAEETEEFPEILEEKLGKQTEEIQPAGYLSTEVSPLSREEIRQLFRRGSRKEIEDFISNYGERQLARNTELLTQYDRRGSIVNLSSSEKELILHGNKNEVKL